MQSSTAKNITALVSVVIDSAQPGPVHVKVWDNPEKYFRLFLAAGEMLAAREGIRSDGGSPKLMAEVKTGAGPTLTR